MPAVAHAALHEGEVARKHIALDVGEHPAPGIGLRASHPGAGHLHHTRNKGRDGNVTRQRQLSATCRCGPVENPVDPSPPIGWPRAIRSPAATIARSRWPYRVATPAPCDRTT